VLGQLIREIRTQKGLSQEKLAELGDFERSYISKIENGDRAIQVVTFIRFAKALDISPTELMSRLQSKLSA
jgi:XRE family transcriptional regulator, regulator of sulfur utilization